MSNATKAIFLAIIALAFMIEGTFKAGKFYRNNCHEHVTHALKSTGAFIITMALYAYEGGIYLYEHKTEYFTKLNNLRERVGQALSYQSPQFA